MSDKTPHEHPDLHEASIATADDLMSIMTSFQHEDHISQLSLPEMEAVVDVVAKVLPAGNVPGLIASGLARLGRKQPSQKDVKRDVNMLFRGMQQMLDHAVFNVFFAGPAQVIWGYQNLLKLTGLDPDTAFPEGTWQFYVDYALREDTARFVIESDGFDQTLQKNKIHLDEVERMTSWVMSAIYTVHNYHALLENEWRERVYIREIISLFGEDDPNREPYIKLFDEWLGVLPYRRMADARGDEDYPAYRRRKFDEWLFKSIATLNNKQKQRWMQNVQAAKQTDLDAYINQMSIRSFLLPDQYGETRTPIRLSDIHIAVVYGEHYYLIPACKPQTSLPAEMEDVRGYLSAIVKYPSKEPSANLAMLAKVRRGQWEAIQRKLPQELTDELNMLRLCPMILNFNPRNRKQSLAEIRQAERGIGNHALTIFDTRESFVFDQSHIYYDGTWAAALAEIMTNEALAWAAYIGPQARAEPTERPYSPRFKISTKVQQFIEKQEPVMLEVSAENNNINLKNVLSMRRVFKQRSDLLRLTVNDLLLLYRAIHAVTYQPDETIVAALEKLKKDKFSRAIAEKTIAAIKPETSVPAVLMPVDASRQSPKDRLYPMTFEVPLRQLHLLELHQGVIAALEAYEAGGNGEEFDELQRNYLGALAGFGTVMRRAKEIANAGLSSSVGTIKLLAHMPTPLQHFLTQIPDSFDMLNDIIKGREVFSNIGRVASSSTLRRFITAKDDNEKKDLAWGIMTDADQTMMISLRDFRPHVRELTDIGHQDIAQRITQDYVNTYVDGFNQYVIDLRRITLKSRETRMMR